MTNHSDTLDSQLLAARIEGQKLKNEILVLRRDDIQARTTESIKDARITVLTDENRRLVKTLQALEQLLNNALTGGIIGERGVDRKQVAYMQIVVSDVLNGVSNDED